MMDKFVEILKTGLYLATFTGTMLFCLHIILEVIAR